MIKVLIVEDSLVTQKHLANILSEDPDIKVIGFANNGEEALEFLKGKRPDVITMDINMPKMDGFEATRRIMRTDPLPIVIVSAYWNPEEVEKTFLAMEAGAVTVIEKPRGLGHPDYKDTARNLILTVKLMSEVKVVKRWDRTKKIKELTPVPPKLDIKPPAGGIKLIAIGASTGGPPAIQTILSGLPKDLPSPLLIVQHISDGFLRGMVEWIGQTSGIPTHIASHRGYLQKGHAYFAPEGLHMGVDSGNRIILSNTKQEHGLRPSASYLFRSVAKIYGRSAIGVLLTGMGEDGADELRLMRERGAITIAQDKESSVVHGMPGKAIKIGGAMYVLPPEKIAKAIEKLVIS